MNKRSFLSIIGNPLIPGGKAGKIYRKRERKKGGREGGGSREEIRM